MWLKYALLILLPPLFFFGAIELVLRLVGFGDPVTFFRSIEVGGRTFTVENPYFGQRFFRQHIPRVPAWNLIPPPSQGIPRIAVIGESAAQGYPLQKIGLGSLLEGILEIQHPGQRFDFINACMTSVNSHVLEEVVTEVAALRPDVSVIYMGNNEVVGPYGPGTPFSSGLHTPWMIWLDKKLRATCTFQLVEHVYLFLAPAGRPRSWEGFDMFDELHVPADSSALAPVYAAFEQNLRSILDRLLSAGSRIVLCTVAVNLADWGPSGSVPLAPDSPAAQFLNEGSDLLEAGRPEAALGPLEQAVGVAPGHAAAFFLLGRALCQSGRTAEGEAALRRARDLDTHRFRADSRINDIIRRTAADYAAQGVVLVDADRGLVEGGVPGFNEFTEHVHLTFDGMKRLGLLVSEVLPPMLPQLGPPRPLREEDVAELRHRLFFTPFDEVLLASVARGVGDSRIFSSRPGAAEGSRFHAALEDSIRRANSLDRSQLEFEFAAAEALRPGAPRTIASFADYLSRMNLPQPAAAAARRVLLKKPTYFEGYRFLADAAKVSGDHATARLRYHEALAIYRLIPDAWKNLGDLALQDGDQQSAAAHYQRAFQLDVGNVPAALGLAAAQAAKGQRSAAVQTLRTACLHNPQNALLHLSLGRLLAAEGDDLGAIASFERALEIDSALSPRDLLRTVSERRPPEEVRAAFEKYAGRFGREADLHNNFAWMLATAPDAADRDPVRAVALAQRAVELSTEPNAYFFGTLSASHAAAGDFLAADVALADALRLAGSHDEALRRQLAAIGVAIRLRQPYVEKPPHSE